MLGVYNLPLLRLYNFIYQESDIEYSVVHSLDGYDEISLTDEFKICNKYGEKIYSPQSIGMEKISPIDLAQGKTQEAAVKIFNDVINNNASTAQTNCVIANAGFAIKTINPNKDISECILEAKESLYYGKAKASFIKFLELNY